MNRIDARFTALKATGRKALVPFITAGDPGKAQTVAIMHALVAAGADVIELGVPFSDPMADGPVIQRSSERALARGVNTDYVFQCVREFRQHDAQTPVVLMGYLNPIEMRGAARYGQQAAEAGVDGVLLVDLPPEEAGPTREAFNAAGLALISLASPTTSEARMATVLATAQGYLYYVSFAGVTGAGTLDTAAVCQKVQGLRARTQVPILVGFGIRDAASVAALAPTADGVVVGSALVEALAGSDEPEATAGVFLAPLRAALENIGGVA